MRNNFTIFYSWQSDLKNNSIQSCIQKAIKEIKKEIKLEINIDRDTRNKSGSPAISATIFNKIEKSDIFICDVTLVNNNWFNKIGKYRITPNPNVLIELGYAIHQLGWERVICVNDLKFSKLEELPFDIRGHRISTFDSYKHDFKESLKRQLMVAITSILENYETIIKEQNGKNNNVHDLNLYYKFTELCSETILLDSIYVSVNSLFIDKYYLEKWDSLQQFYKLSENIFINESLNEAALKFLNELDKFHSIIAKDFHLDDQNGKYREFLSLKMSDIPLTEEQEHEYKHAQIYKPLKEPFRSETWADADKRIYILQDKLFEQSEIVKSSYRDFVMLIKKKLL